MTQPHCPTKVRTGSSFIQPVTAGVLAAIVGFASAFAIVLQGLTKAGATPAQASSGLMVLCVGQGLLAIFLSLRHRQPISIAWSTPGAALLMTASTPHGGFGVAVTAFLISGGLVIIAGLWRPLGRAVASIPLSLASAMLAGILMELCLAPAHAMARLPGLALPIIAAWLLGWVLARRYAVLIAVLATALVVGLSTTMPSDASSLLLPKLSFVRPIFDLAPALGIAIPLFIVTMASQNIPGIAVLKTNGYEPPVREAFITTGAGSLITAFFGGHGINLAAITAALCAGPEAGPDKKQRYLASVVAGITYFPLGLLAGFTTVFIAASPPLLVQTLAGLALLPSLISSLTVTLEKEPHRLAAILTFITAASGISILGIGAAFWGLLVGAAPLLLEHLSRYIREKLLDYSDSL